MNLAGAREQYYSHSGKASDVARQLAFAGLGVIWIFKTSGADGVARVPAGLVCPAALIAAALGCDCLHYASASLFWGVFQRSMERELQRSRLLGRTLPEEFSAPRWINWPAIGFFGAKFLLLIAGYAFLAWALFRLSM